MNNIEQPYFICSWSGGKDSCLALYYAMQQGFKPFALINMLNENPGRSLKETIVKKQAMSLNLPIHIKKTTWNTYEKDFIATLKKENVGKISTCVFGDIDLEEHKNWNEKVCQKVSLKPLLPLWKKDRYKLLRHFLDLGFKAVIVTVNNTQLDPSFLGRELNDQLIEDLKKENIDICGENGEYHTVVTDGPIFHEPLKVKKLDVFKNGNYSYLDFIAEFKNEKSTIPK